jgi:hypothetical protein
VDCLRKKYKIDLQEEEIRETGIHGAISQKAPLQTKLRNGPSVLNHYRK